MLADVTSRYLYCQNNDVTKFFEILRYYGWENPGSRITSPSRVSS